MSELIDTPELDNEVMKAEEFIQLWPEMAIADVIELCQGIQQDCLEGFY